MSDNIDNKSVIVRYIGFDNDIDNETINNYINIGRINWNDVVSIKNNYNFY